MHKVAVTREIPASGLTRLREVAEVRLWPEELPPSPEQLAELLHGCDGALTLLTDAITPELLDREPQLRVISNYAVGYDNIDVPAATARGVAVCNTPGVLTEATADAAFALLMAGARKIIEGVDYVRAGRWRTWGPLLLIGRDLYGSTLGVVGFGRIGQAVARRARGFGMSVLYTDAKRLADGERELGAEYRTLNELLRESDFVTLHAALTPQTHRLIGQRELGQMKREAILVNTARGPLIDTDALVAALRTGEIGSAALDVTDPEPLPVDHPLLRLPNAIVVPHIASATVGTRRRMAELAAGNLLDVLRGERPSSLINPEALEVRAAANR